MKNKIKRNVFISLIIVISAVILIFISNPLIRSEEYIRNDILEKTPVGTSMDNVNKIIEEEEWKISNGYAKGRYENLADEKLSVYIGSYRTVFVTGVYAIFLFNQDSELVDVIIEKNKDAM